MLHFHIVTLFPESVEPYVHSSILGRAIERKKIQVTFYNPKDFATGDRAQDARVDRRPYGGGPGMVLRPEPMLKAVERAVGKRPGAAKIFFATDGVLFDEKMAQALAKKKDILFICGHYEGVDARVQKITRAKKVSVGPFVLTGGELPAALMIDAIARFVPGVLGNENSLEKKRVSTHQKKQAEATASPEVYTRPETLAWKKRKYKVPPVLLTGDHARIEKWKRAKRGLA